MCATLSDGFSARAAQSQHSFRPSVRSCLNCAENISTTLAYFISTHRARRKAYIYKIVYGATTAHVVVVNKSKWKPVPCAGTLSGFLLLRSRGPIAIARRGSDGNEKIPPRFTFQSTTMFCLYRYCCLFFSSISVCFAPPLFLF